MASSYSKYCRHCNRRINLRKMPNGKWVAFEGYDTVHDCKKPIVPSHSSTSGHSRREKDKDIYDDLSIPEVEIDRPGTHPPQPDRKRINAPSRLGSPTILPPVGYEQPHSSVFSKVPPVVWWIAVGLVLFWFARLN